MHLYVDNQAENKRRRRSRSRDRDRGPRFDSPPRIEKKHVPEPKKINMPGAGFVQTISEHARATHLYNQQTQSKGDARHYVNDFDTVPNQLTSKKAGVSGPYTAAMPQIGGRQYGFKKMEYLGEDETYDAKAQATLKSNKTVGENYGFGKAVNYIEETIDDVAEEVEEEMDHQRNIDLMLPGAKVKIHSLVNAAELNGCTGELVTFNADNNRWRVKIFRGSFTMQKDLKPENIRVLEENNKKSTFFLQDGEAPDDTEFRTGSKVRLTGLKSAAGAAMNGKCGILDSFWIDTGRWRVKMEDGTTKDVKPDNLEFQSKAMQRAAADAKPEGFVANPGDTCHLGRFVFEEKLGEGNFSTVYRCKDTEVAGKKYAIKFTRADARMREALEKEVHCMKFIIDKGRQADPEGAFHIVSLAFYEGFEHEGLFACAYELCKYNLRTALEKYGQGRGLILQRGLPLLPTVRNFGRNIFLALRLLKVCGILHCDVKPENLMMSLDNQSVKLADFGSARGMDDRIRTEELQPRYYRAPEVMLGQDYTTQIDMWSAGITLYELATDNRLFEAETSNGMLHEMLKVLGGWSFPKAFSNVGAFALKHFNSDGDFLNAKGDIALGSNNPRVCPMQRFLQPDILKTIQTHVQEALVTPPPDVPQQRFDSLKHHLTDFVTRCLVPNPAQRLTPFDALNHPFFQKGA